MNTFAPIAPVAPIAPPILLASCRSLTHTLTQLLRRKMWNVHIYPRPHTQHPIPHTVPAPPRTCPPLIRSSICHSKGLAAPDHLGSCRGSWSIHCALHGHPSGRDYSRLVGVETLNMRTPCGSTSAVSVSVSVSVSVVCAQRSRTWHDRPRTHN